MNALRCLNEINKRPMMSFNTNWGCFDPRQLFSLDCWTINFTVYCSCVPNQLQRVKLVINIGTFIKTCSFKTKWIAFGFYSIIENVENKKRRFNNICKNKTLGIRGGTIKFHNIILIAIFKRARITIQIYAMRKI